VHEVALCTAIAKVAFRTAQGQPVERVRVDIGHLRQVVPHTLASCWEMVVFDTPLHEVPLEVREVPAVIECRACGSTTELSEPILICGSCGSADTVVLTGDELNVTSIDVTVDVTVDVTLDVTVEG
jgi:hydrogenase nickel incorporation protein HypA/HybF